MLIFDMGKGKVYKRDLNEKDRQRAKFVKVKDPFISEYTSGANDIRMPGLNHKFEKITATRDRLQDWTNRLRGLILLISEARLSQWMEDPIEAD